MSQKSLSSKKTLQVLGIMNGTSLDAIDFVWVTCRLRSANSKFPIHTEFKKHFQFPIPKKLKELLLQAACHQLKVDQLAELHHDLGRLYANCFKRLPGPLKSQLDLIGLHGQTVYHRGGYSTLQIGEGSYLAYESELPIIQDFRVADLAVGGEGAPLASFFHQQIFAQMFSGKEIVLQNIGGIANCTILNPEGQVRAAFDTGPGNMLMDLLVQMKTKGKETYDLNGRLAEKGIPFQKWVDQELKSSYFKRSPPKSCGREEFGMNYLKSFLKQNPGLMEDQMATLLELTSRSIAKGILDHSKNPAYVIVCGGGSQNLQLMKRLQHHMPKTKVCSTDDLKWPSQAIEGAAFALLAAARVWRIPANIPKTTGAKRASLLGKVIEI